MHSEKKHESTRRFHTQGTALESLCSMNEFSSDILTRCVLNSESCVSVWYGNRPNSGMGKGNLMYFHYLKCIIVWGFGQGQGQGLTLTFT